MTRLCYPAAKAECYSSTPTTLCTLPQSTSRNTPILICQAFGLSCYCCQHVPHCLLSFWADAARPFVLPLCVCICESASQYSSIIIQFSLKKQRNTANKIIKKKKLPENLSIQSHTAPPTFQSVFYGPSGKNQDQAFRSFRHILFIIIYYIMQSIYVL